MDLARQMLAAGSMRRRPASDWQFTQTAPIVSDGSSGSYARAKNNRIARQLFTAANELGTASVVFWAQTNAAGAAGQQTFCEWGAALTGNPVGRIVTTTTPRLQGTTVDDAGATLGTLQSSVGSQFDGTVWTLVTLALSRLGSDMIVLARNTTKTSNSDASPDAHTAGEEFFLFADRDGANRLVGAIQNFAILSGAIGDSERSLLVSIGRTANLRDYFAGSLPHYYPAYGDPPGLLIDRGDVGGCDIDLFGNVAVSA